MTMPMSEFMASVKALVEAAQDVRASDALGELVESPTPTMESVDALNQLYSATDRVVSELFGIVESQQHR